MRSSSTISLTILAGAMGGVIAASACNGDFHFDEHDEVDAATLEGGADDDAAPDGNAGVAPYGRCSNDDGCAALGLRCNVDSGRCVACLGDGDCTGATLRRCEPTMHVCVACLVTEDCGTRQRCEPITHRCIDTCAERAELCAPAGFVCDELDKRCIECHTSAHCAGSFRGPRCDPAIGTCVECADNATCPATRPTCDRRTGRCVGCVSSDECPSGSACDPEKLVCRRVSQL